MGGRGWVRNAGIHSAGCWFKEPARAGACAFPPSPPRSGAHLLQACVTQFVRQELPPAHEPPLLPHAAQGVGKAWVALGGQQGTTLEEGGAGQHVLQAVQHTAHVSLPRSGGTVGGRLDCFRLHALGASEYRMPSSASIPPTCTVRMSFILRSTRGSSCATSPPPDDPASSWGRVGGGGVQPCMLG